MANILVIDDEPLICRFLSEEITLMGHTVESAATRREGLEKALSRSFDVVFLDVRLPDGSGLAILPRIREGSFPPEVIIMTAAGDPDGAETAIKSGAWDYIEKPSSLHMMTLPLVRALQYRQAQLNTRTPVVLDREGIVGSGSRMRGCLDLLAQAAGSDANVLITGETGTGKELFARAIHRNSRRAAKDFIVVDCAALTETLIQSILFGHERGSFTGADRAQAGLIGQADGGTLFLDEVGELTLTTQKTFLRVLQERCFRPVGGSREVRSDFRLVAATNRDLPRMVQEGRFREDLLYRLAAFAIEVPPLRERREDIRELAFHFTAKLSGRYGREIKGFAPEFFEALTAYAWPGNVRELINALESSFACAYDEPTLFPRHLPTEMRIRLARDTIREPAVANAVAAEGMAASLPKYADFRRAAELQYLRDLMRTAGGAVREACRISGLSRSRLYALLKDHGIERCAAP